MNRRRQHPAAVAARRARFYRASGGDERTSAFEERWTSRASSWNEAERGGASSRGVSPSERVDGGSFAPAEDAA